MSAATAALVQVNQLLCPFWSHEHDRNESTMADFYIPVKYYLLWDVAWSPRGSVKDTSPMCHAPLQHGLRQAIHNTLGLGSWFTVSYSLYSEIDLPHRQSRDHPDQPRDRFPAIRHLPTCPAATQARAIRGLVRPFQVGLWDKSFQFQYCG
jgi:hypothetical protein